jgi:uncharacterized protein YbjT (DUF2867 family)
MILVTGATGHVGRHLVTQLLDRGEEVRALTRDPGRAGLPPGVDVVAGDLDDVETLTPAMRGAGRVFLVSFGPGTAARDANVARAAATAGAHRIVKISVLGVEDGDRDPVTTWHRAGEEAVDRAGIPRTFLRCGEFMSNALMWAETIRRMGTAFVPFAENPSAPIDPLDVAMVAARCLTDSGAGGSEALAITGPEVLTGTERVRRLGEMLGTTLRCVDVPRHAAYEKMTAAGQSSLTANALLDMMEFKSSGRGAVPLGTVEAVTGCPPHTFDDWAARNLAAFR